MIHLLCSCDDALATRPELYDDFLCTPSASSALHAVCCRVLLLILPIVWFPPAVLHFQLAETPTDFFVDIVSQDNFLVTCLSVSPLLKLHRPRLCPHTRRLPAATKSLFQRIREVDGVDAALATRAEKFQR